MGQRPAGHAHEEQDEEQFGAAVTPTPAGPFQVFVNRLADAQQHGRVQADMDPVAVDERNREDRRDG